MTGRLQGKGGGNALKIRSLCQTRGWWRSCDRQEAVPQCLQPTCYAERDSLGATVRELKTKEIQSLIVLRSQGWKGPLVVTRPYSC